MQAVTQERDMSKFLHFFVTFMKFGGLWPLDTRNKFAQVSLQAVRIIVGIILAYITFGLLMQAIFYSNLKEIGLTVEIATMTSTALYKMIFIVTNKDRFGAIVQNMKTHFKAEYRRKESVVVRILDSHTKCVLFSILYVSYGVVCMIIWAFIPLIQFYVDEKIGSQSSDMANSTGTASKSTYDRIISYGLPLFCWFPYSSDKTPLYELTYTLEFISLYSSIWFYLVNDSFFFGTIYLVSVQYRILREMLQDLNSISIVHEEENPRVAIKTGSQSTLGLQNTGNNLIAVAKKRTANKLLFKHRLRECAVYHSTLVRFIWELESLNSTLILADIMHAIISITFVMFTWSTSETIIEWIKMYLFFIISIGHQMLNAEFGELFIDSQRKMINAIYNVNWYEAGIEERKLLVTMMTNSQNIIALSGAEMYILCRATFVKLVKSLFSYYMVLRQRMDK